MKKDNSTHFIAKKVGMAINRYSMIEDGDRILVGVSGGKDSLTLLKILQERKRWVPIEYRVKALHVITDYDMQPSVNREKLRDFFESVGCEYDFKEIEIASKNRLGRQDCFWCSWNRRKAIFQAAAEYGFSKVALAHHKDDLVETILMNMIFNGEISGMKPVQELFGGKITIIRPMVLLEEKEIRRFVKHNSLPEIKSTCPRNGNSKRAVIKEIVSRLSRTSQDIKSNIVRAPSRVREEYIEDVTGDEDGLTGELPDGRAVT